MVPTNSPDGHENQDREETEEDTVEFKKRSLELGLSAELINESSAEIAALSHPGAVRANNEDHYGVFRRTRSSKLLATNLPPSDFPMSVDHVYMMTVADGLGGAVFGELASSIAVKKIQEVASRIANWVMNSTEASESEIDSRVQIYADAIQEEFRQQAAQNPALEGMATTLTSLYAFGRNAIVANVGDSRAYLIQDKRLIQITTDHTVEQELLDRGEPHTAASSFRNILTRCFSTQPKPVSVDVFHLELKHNDQILLCTDGLTDMISSKQILDIINSTNSSKIACEQLVAAAITAGGLDNITSILARFRLPERKKPSRKVVTDSAYDTAVIPAQPRKPNDDTDS